MRAQFGITKCGLFPESVTFNTLLRIPGHSGHPFRSNPDTYSV